MNADTCFVKRGFLSEYEQRMLVLVSMHITESGLIKRVQ